MNNTICIILHSTVNVHLFTSRIYERHLNKSLFIKVPIPVPLKLSIFYTTVRSAKIVVNTINDNYNKMSSTLSFTQDMLE